MTDEPTTNAARLLSRAQFASGRAADARRLGDEIEVYRQVIVARVDQSLLRHTAEVWNSRAAVESRAELLAAGFTLWQVGQDLLDTRVALDLAAEDLDDEAAGCRRAATVEAQAAQASRVPKSTGVG